MKSVASDRISDASSRLWSKTRRRWVGLLLISAALMVTIFAGCGDLEPTDLPPPVSFPKHDYPLGTDRGGDYFDGQLVLKDGCLLVEVPSNPNNAPWPARLAIWPSSFSLDVASGTVRVVDGQGQVAAQVGDYVRISRAELTPKDHKLAELIAGLPEHCPAGRTFVGAMTVFDPKKEVTKLRLQSPEVLLLRQETVMAAERIFLTAAGVGELVLDGPCLRIKGGYNTTTVVWPPGFAPHVEDGVVQVRNGAGQAIARVGDEIAGGGGYRKSSDKECPGEAFHIHSIKVLPDAAVYFPQWDEGIKMGQVVKPHTGELALDGKCLVLRNILEGEVPNDNLLFWPEIYGLNVQDGAVEVLDATGRIVARVGDEVQVNAFNVTYDQAVKHGGLDKITPACSGALAVEEVIEPPEDAHKGSVPIISVETSLIQSQTLPPRTVQDLVNRSQAIVIGTVTAISEPVVERPYDFDPADYAELPDSEWPSIEAAYWTIGIEEVLLDDGNIEANPKLRMEPNPPHRTDKPLPELTARYLFTMGRNPDSLSYGISADWMILPLDGGRIRNLDGNVPFYGGDADEDSLVEAMREAVLDYEYLPPGKWPGRFPPGGGQQ